MKRWQKVWDESAKGRWTHRLIPQVDKWLNRRHGEVNYYLTQMLSGHGCYRSYLYKYKYEVSPECPTCAGINEDASEHVFFTCPRYDTERDELETSLHQRITPERLTEVMISSERAWCVVNIFASKVLKDLRNEERMRKKKEE